MSEQKSNNDPKIVYDAVFHGNLNPLTPSSVQNYIKKTYGKDYPILFIKSQMDGYCLKGILRRFFGRYKVV